MADGAGYVTRISTRNIGLAVVTLGGGRTRAEDGIDHAVGFSALLATGSAVMKDTPIGFVHARTEEAAQSASMALQKAYSIGLEKPSIRPLIHDRFQGKGL